MADSAPDPTIVERFISAVPDAKQILSGQYDIATAARWYTKALVCYKLLYGTASPPFKELLAFREGLLKKTANSADLKAKVGEFISLAEFLNEGTLSSLAVATSRRSTAPANRRVFIVHGHDELNRLRLEKMLKEHFGLEPIVISSKPGQSRSIIDKFEEHAKHCTFAMALFTPDDLVTTDKEKYYQSRPNIIFETGWFVGRLGKERVIIFLKEGTQIYSDFDGVSRIQFRDDVQDSFVKIKSELEAARLI